MLGCWMGVKVDIKERKARAFKIWLKVQQQLKRSKLASTRYTRSHRVRLIAAQECVKKETKKLQSLIDRCYRHIWSGGRGAPLRLIQQKGKNMQDIRNILGIVSIRTKI